MEILWCDSCMPPQACTGRMGRLCRPGWGCRKQKAGCDERCRDFFASGVLGSLPKDAWILLAALYPVETKTVVLCAATARYRPFAFAGEPAALELEKPVYRLIWPGPGLVLQEEPG